MLNAAEGRLPRAQSARIATLPVPIHGWSARDTYAGRLRYAPVLQNWMVVNGRLEIRPGYSPHATGLPSADVETLMGYAAAGTEALFAACDGAIYDVSASGAVGAAAVSSLANSRFQHTLFSTTSGSYLVAVNGADGVRTYDGAAWAVQSIAGVAAADLIAVSSHQARLWFIQHNTLDAWYLDPYAVSGTATRLPLGAQFTRGGTLQAIAGWSYDGGTGPDDYLVFVTSEGEIAIYAGTDPASSSTFSKVGVFKTSKPLGRRCLVKYGADLALLTESGVVLVSDVLNEVGEADALSDQIRDEFIAAADTARSAFGWDLTLYSRRGWLMANIPLNTAGRFDQYVYNPLMKAWFPFAGLPAVCWATSGDAIFFGGNGAVHVWDDGSTDDDGSNVESDIQFAWWNFRTMARKRFTLIRPNFFTDGTVAPQVSMRVDYDDTAASAASEPSTAPVGSAWGDGGGGDDWDEGIWGGGLAPYVRWLTASGVGIWGAPRMQVATLTATVALTGIDVAFEPGGIV